MAAPALAPPSGGRSMISFSAATVQPRHSTDIPATDTPVRKAALVNICLDGNDVVHHVAYLGPEAPSAPRLAGLVGLPFSYLAPAFQLPFRAGDPAVAQAALSCLQQAAAEVAHAQQQPTGNPAAWQLQQQQGSQAVSMKGVPGMLSCPDPGVYVLSEHDLLAKLSEPWADLLFDDDFRTLRRQAVRHCLMCSQELGGKGVTCAKASSAAAAVVSDGNRIQDRVVEHVLISPASVQDAAAELIMHMAAKSSYLLPYMSKLASADAKRSSSPY
jgi:hypothetical protein